MISLIIIFPLGTFGRIFHGILVDEKDPNKEKQAFVKTVKGRIFSHTFLKCFPEVDHVSEILSQILSLCQTFKSVHVNLAHMRLTFEEIWAVLIRYRK